MSTQAAPQSLISVRTALIAVLVGAISFASLLVLSAFAPELRDKNTAGLHAYSKSALGYNFAVNLLQELGYTTEISQDLNILTYRPDPDFLILTPANRYDSDELSDVDFDQDGPTLVVLPKRWGFRDPLNRRFQGRTGFVSLDDINRLAGVVDDSIEVRRVDAMTELDGPSGALPVTFLENTQLMKSDELIPVIGNRDGVMLGRISNTQIYILADPELFNTHGLSHVENAQAMLVGMREMIGKGKGISVIFDTTLHGFERSRNLLRMLFEPPLLGATLFGFATAILLGWGAFLRFGRPAEAPAEIATGRQSLIESTSGLFQQTGQQASLAEDYEALAARQTLRGLGYSEDVSTDQALAILDERYRKEKRERSDLKPRPTPGHVSSAHQLLQFAQDYHTWKEELSDERE